MSALRLAAQTPDFFAHAGRAPVERGEAFGCRCANCGRDVAAPFEYQGALIWCVYCGIEAGHVPAVETPYGFRWYFGVTRQECVEDAAALKKGDWEQVAEARARRNGRVVEFLW